MPEGFSTDSYPKPQQGSFVDSFKGYQELERNKLGIDKQKLDLVKQGMDNLVNEFKTAGPNATYKDLVDIGQRAVNIKSITPDMFKEYIRNMPTDQAKVRPYVDQQIQRLQSTQQSLDWYHGSGSRMQDVGGGQQPVQDYQGQVRATGPVVPSGLPAGTPGFQKPTPDFPQGRIAPIGPAQSPGLPVAPQFQPSGGMTGGAASGATPVPTTNVQPPNRLGATRQPPTQDVPGQSFNSRFSGASPGNPPPGFEQGEAAVGGASGAQLAKAREHAANFQREIFPLTQAIPLLEKLGTKGTGPGIDTINNIKSFVLSNVPGVTEKMLSGVKDVDELKKYLVDFVNQTGNSGTNDKLAAAFAGNPSIHISNAAAKDVTKSALALRLMQQAQQLEFEKTGLPAYRFSKWAAENNNQLDPRAFGVNYMDADAKKKLNEQLKKNPKEAELFDKSLELAHKAGYIVLGK